MFKQNRSRSFSNNNFSRSSRNFSRSNQFRRSHNVRPNRGERIDESRFVKKSDQQASQEIKVENTFASFGFCSQLSKNLQARNYTLPTPIQDQSIGHILKGRDLVGLANTGTGKTAAFLLPLIEKCFADKSKKVLIIAPTRELAQQINDEFKKFSQSMGLYSAICVGGIPIYRQISTLRQNPNFVIGTPGRLKDLKERRVIDFSRFRFVVLDEIDRMLDMGFVEEIRKILSELPRERQSLFFSATIPQKIKDLVNQFLNNPVSIQVSTGETAQNVDQDIIRVSSNQKFNRLKDLLITQELQKVLIFSETKRGVERLTEDLLRDGFKADSIHGNKRQTQRQRALLKFKENEVQVLVATDVAARGLDINNITHVINYTLPQTYNDYIHRIGRTGRGDKKGFALTFVS
ncbi:MAG: DEAD/DEAH box helicase [Candidatus Berkelbacteria bacterium]|nr:DEAD/DEAH box helicase [Candidatus Berkelbacteria bacterium]